MRPNLLRQKLAEGKPTISTRVHTVWPSVVEAIGHTGMYDYVEFVAEYGPSDLHDLDNLCRAAELHGMGAMIKIDQSLMPFLAQRGIGAGFGSVLFTDTRSIDEVRECIRAARPDHPDYGGHYGVATRRNSYMGYGGTPEYVQSIGDTVLAFMIEKKGAVDNLEQILEEPGVDMVQWGGNDFAVNIGRPGRPSIPRWLRPRRRPSRPPSRWVCRPGRRSRAPTRPRSTWTWGSGTSPYTPTSPSCSSSGSARATSY